MLIKPDILTCYQQVAFLRNPIGRADGVMLKRRKADSPGAMRVVLVTNYHASRKEPLVELLERIHQAFLDSGLRDPRVHFTLGDAPVPGFASAVSRALKKFPKLEPFHCSHPLLPGSASVPQISNCPGTPAADRELDLFTLFAVAQGVPRSLPFHRVMVHFHHPEFGEALPANGLAPASIPGIIIGDSWWINGRNRSLLSLHTVEAEEQSKTLPPPSPAVATVLAACGKPRETTQLPMPSLDSATTIAQASQADPEIVRRVREVVLDYRGRLAEIVEHARMPHDLPSAAEALRTIPLGTTSGPKKPALVAAFKSMGYGCRGESGAFTLRRKTEANLTVEISLDVGTWSNSLTGFYEIHGIGFMASLSLPPSRNAIGAAQYQIGDGDRWKKIVENLAALVAELDRTFLPAVEAAVGQAPAWYQPQS